MLGKIADTNLAPLGKRSYEWARAHMTIFDYISKKSRKSRPLLGIKLGLCLHITKETSGTGYVRAKVGC